MSISRLGHPKFTYTYRTHRDSSICILKLHGFWCYRVWHWGAGAMPNLLNNGYSTPMAALRAAKRAIDLDPDKNPMLNGE